MNKQKEKLVSVVTSTFERHEMLLNHNIPSVQQQTYPNIEHIIVSDKHDKRLLDKLYNLEDFLLQKVPVQLCLLGRDWKEFGKGNWGEAPRMVGTYLARGDYIAYVDDDDSWYSDHIKKCVDLLEKDNVDFVYSKFERYFRNKYHSTLGALPLKCGNIGVSDVVHKVELLNISNWQPTKGADDWELIDRWIKGGAKYSFLDEVTVKVNLNENRPSTINLDKNWNGN